MKAVKGCNCNGCLFYDWNEGDICLSVPIGSCGGNYVIKDLGILNEDGCLPNCWGQYPAIRESNGGLYLMGGLAGKRHYLCIAEGEATCFTESYATKQEAIDAWNRRE